MMRLRFTQLLLLSVTLGGSSHTVDAGNPTQFGPINKHAICDRLETAVKESPQARQLPGISTAVILPDRSQCRITVGLADIERNVPLSQKHRFFSGSTGKTFVAATTLYLERMGLLELDDPISRYLSEEPFFSRLPNADQITVRQLLNHSSGLADHVYLQEFAEAILASGTTRKALTPTQTIALILDKPALAAPGEVYSYTDTGYILLGLVIEKASGRTYYNLLDDVFLERLQLTDTSPSDSMVHRNLATGYVATEVMSILAGRMLDMDGNPLYHPGSEWTGGGLVTTPADLSRWAWMLYRGEVMEKSYRENMLQAGPPAEGANTGHYGLGVYIAQTEHGIRYGHGGWAPGYRTVMYYLPEMQIAIAVQANSDAKVDNTPSSAHDLAMALLDVLSKTLPEFIAQREQ